MTIVGPQGTLTTHTLPPGKIYPGVTHTYQVYVPAQYDPTQPAPCMVFLDGAWIYVARMRAVEVLDQAIAAGDIPPLIGIFVDPGWYPVADPDTQQARMNRHVEYDALTSTFARFLTEELLPEVAKAYPLSADPNDRGIVGLSSGAIGSFIAGWHPPHHFRRMYISICTFVDMLGAHSLPIWVRKTEPRPLRIFQQETTDDNDRLWGNWPQGNAQMAEALAFSHYDAQFVVGPGIHDFDHATETMPDALRWLWRDYPQPITAATTGPIYEALLIPGEAWELVWESDEAGAGSAGDPLAAADREGRLWLTDPATGRILRRHDDGSSETIAEETGRITAIAMGPDGHLYASQPDQQRIVAYGADGSQRTVAEGITAHALTLTAAGLIIGTDPAQGIISVVHPDGTRRDYRGDGLREPATLALSPDQVFLAVLDRTGVWGWSFHLTPEGELHDGQPFYRVLPDEAEPTQRAAALAIDTTGDLYIPNPSGITLVTQSGRTRETINAPEPGMVSSVAFGGPQRDWLIASQHGRLSRRRIQRQGAVPWQPVKPPPPRV
ncbi:MAG: SMP-30/gluconolactonase/LRE family protein [Chloroflexia bacterium]|nr:SMP-30/gluconolactonase/LRE family protein [Chloroflexia bacterium]